jgi:hypothetical protein
MGNKRKHIRGTRKSGHISHVKAAPEDQVEPIQEVQASSSIVAKINKITSWQASIIITVLGFVTYFTGLNSPFQGDDTVQITTNVPVHSIGNIRLFFEGGTFYNGGGLTSLTGSYYRPLETIVYSLLYTLFGSHSLYYHLLQELIYISSAIILYLVFRYTFKSSLALILSLIFLVHPLNSQVVYSIPSMTDALFFFFGTLAFYLLLRFNSIRSLLLVSGCLFLSLLSKESAVIFIIIALLYLFWFNRERLYAFIGIMVIPVIVYTALRFHASGLTSPSIAPIDKLSLAGRLLTTPSIVLFYLSKFVFPYRLAQAYYWVHPAFSFRYFMLPLLVDVATGVLIIYVAFVVRRKASKAQFYSYLLFTLWAVLGLVPYTQVIPVDMTVSETWFYLSMAGVLGMIGIALGVFRIRPKWILVVGISLICVLGFRTALRGNDWKNPTSLAYKDIASSPQDYIADNDISANLISQGKFALAKEYALQSVSIFPTYVNYNNLGVTMLDMDDYAGAYSAYTNILKLKNGDNYNQVIENLGGLTVVYGNPQSNKIFLLNAVKKYPQDSRLWAYLAFFYEQHNDNTDAKIAIANAATYGNVPPAIYNDILADKPFTLYLGTGTSVEIR